MSRFPSQLSLYPPAAPVDPFRRQLRSRLKPAICRLFKEKVHGEQGCYSYAIAEDAQAYLESYVIEKLAAVCEPQPPADIFEAGDKLAHAFASCNLEPEVLNDLRDQASRRKKKSVAALYDIIHKALRCDEVVCLFIVMVTEHVLCEILRVSYTYMIKIKISEIKKVDIRIVVDTFFSNQSPGLNEQDYMVTFPSEYRQAINELIYFEETFAQQLQIISQLFKQPLVDLCPSSPDVDTIFSTISAIAECTNYLYVALDDSRNITEHPPIGHCFYELSEEGHFDSYAKYAQDVLTGKCCERLLELLSNRQVQEKFEAVGREMESQTVAAKAQQCIMQSSAPPTSNATTPASRKTPSADLDAVGAQEAAAVSAADSTGGGDETRAVMLVACRYLLPKLLLVPIYHFLYYDCILDRFEQLQEKNMRHRNGAAAAAAAAARTAAAGAETEPADEAEHHQLHHQQHSLSGSPVQSASGGGGSLLDRRRSSSSLPSEDCSDDRDTIVQTRSILVSTRHRIKRILDDCERRPAVSVSTSSGDDTRSMSVASLSISPTGGGGGGGDFGASDDDLVAAGRGPGRCVLLSPLASRLFFHASMSAPDSNHVDKACSKKLAQLRQLTRSASELDAKPRCCIFYREGALYQLERGGRFQERRLYLFNNRLFVLKTTSKALALRSNEDYKLKRVVYLLQHRFLVVDHPKPCRLSASEDEVHTFSIEYLAPPDSVEALQAARQKVTLGTKSLPDKEEWMLILVYLQAYHMFEGHLSLRGLKDAPERITFPLDSRGYEYWQPDSEQLIEMEETCENSSSESRVVRRATLNKLVERMTDFSGNIDSRLMKVFLMTYRSFCTPQRLLNKLISRFNLPEYTYVDFQTDPGMPVSQAQQRKREFEDKYCRKVRLRVLKVMTTWLDSYFHDFEKNPELIDQLRDFLTGPTVDKLYDINKFQVPNVLKQLDRRIRGEARRELASNSSNYPEILWHAAREPRDFNLMSLHPLELARQITLHMFSLYMRIQPWELVTGDWMKTNEKQLKAPNVHNLIRYTNRLTWWCCYNVLHTQNLDERRQVLQRIYEVMKHFRDLNNFLGLAALDSVFINSSIQYIRLQHTWKLIKNGKDNEFLVKAQELVSNGNSLRQYDERLRTLDGACVPNLRYHLSLIFRLLEINRVKGDLKGDLQQLALEAEAEATVMIPFFCYRQVRP